jgi:hypothetical protein
MLSGLSVSLRSEETSATGAVQRTRRLCTPFSVPQNPSENLDTSLTQKRSPSKSEEISWKTIACRKPSQLVSTGTRFYELQRPSFVKAAFLSPRNREAFQMDSTE